MALKDLKIPFFFDREDQTDLCWASHPSFYALSRAGLKEVEWKSEIVAGNVGGGVGKTVRRLLASSDFWLW